MGKHDLGGNASVEVSHITASFTSRAPTIDYGPDGTRMVTFANPVGRTNTAEIKFKFKTTNAAQKFSFGIKQFVSITSNRNTYKGNKSIDGKITEWFSLPSRFTLDVSKTVLQVLYDRHNLPTGARATAPHAPFFQEAPQSVRDGSETQMAIQDMPGSSFALELRNVSTDRVNYLDNVNIFQKFLTVLIAVTKADDTHIPIEAAYWQSTIGGPVAWDASGKPDVSKMTYNNNGIGTFREINPDFPVCDFDLLTNADLTASDCIVQKFNDALFTVRGLYKRQDFTKPTYVDTSVQAKGYTIVQSPTM